MARAAVAGMVVASGVAVERVAWTPPMWNKVLTAAVEATLIEDVLLPEQLLNLPHTETTPERRLMLAVVHQAWNDLRSPAEPVRVQAWKWFSDPSPDHLFAFARICEEFNWTQSWVLAQLRRTDVAPTYILRRLKL